MKIALRPNPNSRRSRQSGDHDHSHYEMIDLCDAGEGTVWGSVMIDLFHDPADNVWQTQVYNHLLHGETITINVLDYSKPHSPRD